MVADNAIPCRQNTCKCLHYPLSFKYHSDFYGYKYLNRIKRVYNNV